MRAATVGAIEFPTLSPELRSHRLASPQGPVDVVIDTDVTNEVDDQFAVVWALLRPDRLRVKGLHACPYSLSAELVRGPAMLADLDRRNLAATLASLGASLEDVPTVEPAEGVERATAELHRICQLTGTDAALVHPGSDQHLADTTTEVPSEATARLVELARDAEDTLYVVALGCATNIAAALLAAPDIVTRLTVVWTSAYPSFWPYPNASYNLALDLPAARVLLGSGVPLVYMPGYYVGEELRVTLPEIREYVQGRGAVGDYLFRTYRDHPINGDHHARSKVIWDMVGVGWLLEPAWFSTVLAPTPSLGDDLRWQAEPAAVPMREALDCDRDALFADLYRCLADRTDPSDPADRTWHPDRADRAGPTG